jgi:SRSO17 transposase
MLLRAQASGMSVRWVTADALYGSDHRFRRTVEECGWHYMLAVKSDQTVWIGKSQYGVQALIKADEASKWQVLSCGEGAKGQRLYRWATVELAHPDGEHLLRWVVGRQNLGDPQKVVYYLASAPVGIPLSELVRVAGVRWTVEQCFQIAKGEVGLDQYEVRTWQGWYRHITLAMLAHAFLTVMRAWAVEVEKKGEVYTGSLWEFKQQRGLYYP